MERNFEGRWCFATPRRSYDPLQKFMTQNDCKHRHPASFGSDFLPGFQEFSAVPVRASDWLCVLLQVLQDWTPWVSAGSGCEALVCGSPFLGGVPSA